MKLRLLWNMGARPLSTFVLAVIRLYCVLLLRARTHMFVYMRLDGLAGMNIKTTVVLDVR